MTADVPPQRAWFLRRGARIAECLVSRHVLGWEVRYAVDGELIRSEVFREQSVMLIEVERRKAEFESKGWVEPMEG
jgi:hypothetical protein